MNAADLVPVGKESLSKELSLKLFIVGGRPESAMAIIRMRKILGEHNLAQDVLQIVDIQKEPQLAKEAQIVGTPSLVKDCPLPRRFIVGDLSNADIVVETLGLGTKNQYAETGLIDKPQVPSVLSDTALTDLKTIRVMLTNFSPVVASGIRAILPKEKNVRLTVDASDAGEALSLLKGAAERGEPTHVVLIAIRPGLFNSVDVTRLIKQRFPEVSVILISELEDNSNVIEAILAGAAGYMFVKDVSGANFSENIRWILSGGMAMNVTLLRNAVETLLQGGQNTSARRLVDTAHLTEREVQVLQLMGNGISNGEISKALGISIDTAKKHTSSIVKKLASHSRTQACIIAAQAALGSAVVANLATAV